METLEDLELYFYIACGVGVLLFILLLILIICLFYKLRSSVDDDIPGVYPWNYPHSLRKCSFTRPGKKSENISNQLNTQTNMMSEFCYSNPEIIPGEELSRRGFSMYSGTDNFVEEVEVKNAQRYSESRSKF
ncbi:uncharacterized protein [Prorops nasuta]|uniref:uncharacterized protein isoform X2 n=1 Tax=Prorops nasuta TaxID=863751 RepID=UPI0034CEC644